jgi:23S rRNA pseudouridine955/2504/2580 synthase
MNSLRKAPKPASAPAGATQAQVDEAHAGQRLDNYLFRLLKGVPKSHVYRILRTGQVRVNSARAEATYRMQPGDRVRIPPLRLATRAAPVRAGSGAVPVLPRRTLYEDDHVLVIDKPAGMAVHGGSGVSRGVIEQLRRERPELRALELVHRLDRDTSGVLVLAKKRSALIELHRQLREGEVEKRYLVLVAGAWRNATQAVKLPLRKYVTAAGERRVSIDLHGMAAHTVFTLQRRLAAFSLLAAEIKTGRTHQIRVHLAHLGFPIAGDDKYGDFALNKTLARQGLKRMFLHAAALTFTHPASGEPLHLSAPLAPDLTQFLSRLEASPSARAAVES